MKLVLAAETSTPLGSVALIRYSDKSATGEVLGEAEWDRQQSHSEIITSEAEKLLKKHNLKLSDIDAYACGIGPGSFTGIRVALNFIKTLAYSFQKPVYVMNSLKLLALPALQNNEATFCMQSAFRDLFYVAEYKTSEKKSKNEIEEILPPSAWTLEQLEAYSPKPAIFLGKAFSEYEKHFSQDLRPKIQRLDTFEDRPRSSNFQFVNLPQIPQSEILQWFQVIALYVRASEAEEKLRKGGSFKSESKRVEDF